MHLDQLIELTLFIFNVDYKQPSLTQIIILRSIPCSSRRWAIAAPSYNCKIIHLFDFRRAFLLGQSRFAVELPQFRFVPIFLRTNSNTLRIIHRSQRSPGGITLTGNINLVATTIYEIRGCAIFVLNEAHPNSTTERKTIRTGL